MHNKPLSAASSKAVAATQDGRILQGYNVGGNSSTTVAPTTEAHRWYGTKTPIELGQIMVRGHDFKNQISPAMTVFP